MSRYSKISSLFFLTAFSIFWLHQLLPHVHHHHDSYNVSVEKLDDHHSHENHTHQSGENGSENEEHENFLSFFLDNHSHISHAHELIQWVKEENHITHLEVIPEVGFVESISLPPKLIAEKFSRYSLFRSEFHKNPFLLNCSLRAPPSLG